MGTSGENMRGIGSRIFSWPTAVVVLLLGITLWAFFIISGIQFADGDSRINADLQLHRYATPPSTTLDYSELADFLTPMIEKRVAPRGSLRYRFRPNELRLAAEVVPFLLNDGRIAADFNNLPPILALRDAATYGAYAYLSLENKGKQPARNLQVRIPGARAARYWIPARVEPDPDNKDPDGKDPIEEKFVEVAAEIEKGRFTVSEVLPGETVRAEIWLATYPDPSDWRWAKRVQVRIGEARITPNFHHLVSPVYERLDRNSFMALAAFAILVTMVGAATFFYVISLWWRRGPNGRRRRPKTA